MKNEKISFRGVDYSNVTLDEAAALCRGWLADPSPRTPRLIATPNAEIAQEAVGDGGFASLLNAFDLVVADGAGVVLASKLAGRPLPKGKVAGIELCERIIADCAADGRSVFLYGGKPQIPGAEGTVSVAQAAAAALTAKYPTLRVAGCADGYRKDDDEVVRLINESGADFLAVFLGAPKQERWLAAHRGRLSVRLAGGFGGSVDIYAGVSRRAPDVFVRLRLEWLYRLAREPKRIGRMMRLPRFVFGSVGKK